MVKNPGGDDMQDRILKATRRILESQGLAYATTKAIAKEAGCAEGSLYVHFKNRGDLLLAVFKECLPQLLNPLSGLAFQVGEGTVEGNLKNLFIHFLPFYRQVAPLMGALFSDLSLLQSYQESLQTSGQGPHISKNHLSAYLKAEQRLGRIQSDVDIDFFSEVLMGGCFQRAFREQFSGVDFKRKNFAKSDSEFATNLARAMAMALGATERRSR
jgi:AcrR family transcriptional regulator